MTKKAKKNPNDPAPVALGDTGAMRRAVEDWVAMVRVTS
jgi:hypothetical protein